MVNKDSLDPIFAALGDATRRAMVSRLASGRMTITELSEPFSISKPAITKHIKKLEQVGLLVRHIDGRTHYCELRPEPLKNVATWLSFYEQFWNTKLDQLAAHLASNNDTGNKK